VVNVRDDREVADVRGVHAVREGREA
jgi:hypothetical protein